MIHDCHQSLLCHPDRSQLPKSITTTPQISSYFNFRNSTIYLYLSTLLHILRLVTMRTSSIVTPKIILTEWLLENALYDMTFTAWTLAFWPQLETVDRVRANFIYPTQTNSTSQSITAGQTEGLILGENPFAWVIKWYFHWGNRLADSCYFYQCPQVCLSSWFL